MELVPYFNRLAFRFRLLRYDANYWPYKIKCYVYVTFKTLVDAKVLSCQNEKCPCGDTTNFLPFYLQSGTPNNVKTRTSIWLNTPLSFAEDLRSVSCVFDTLYACGYDTGAVTAPNTRWQRFKSKSKKGGTSGEAICVEINYLFILLYCLLWHPVPTFSYRQGNRSITTGGGGAVYYHHYYEIGTLSVGVSPVWGIMMSCINEVIEYHYLQMMM